jgi:hypothetical protein
LATIIASVTGRAIHLDEDLLAHGVESLEVVQIALEIEARLGLPCAHDDIFAFASCYLLATELESRRAAGSRPEKRSEKLGLELLRLSNSFVKNLRKASEQYYPLTAVQQAFYNIYQSAPGDRQLWFSFSGEIRICTSSEQVVRAIRELIAEEPLFKATIAERERLPINVRNGGNVVTVDTGEVGDQSNLHRLLRDQARRVRTFPETAPVEFGVYTATKSIWLTMAGSVLFWDGNSKAEILRRLFEKLRHPGREEKRADSYEIEPAFLDYARWESAMIHTWRNSRDWEFWAKEFSSARRHGAIHSSSLPGIRHGAAELDWLSDEDLNAIKSLKTYMSVSYTSLVIAAFVVAVSAELRRDAITLLVPYLNRRRKEWRYAIGSFADSLLLLFAPPPSFDSVGIRSVHRQLHERLSKATIPFPILSEENLLESESVPYMVAPQAEFEADDAHEISETPPVIDRCLHPMHLFMRRYGGRRALVLAYQTSMFQPGTVRRISERLRFLLFSRR